MNNAFYEHGRLYYEKGFSVIPVNGKRPLVKNWSEFSTRLPKEDEFVDWTKRFPKAGFGIVCGPQSGISAFDYDLEISDPKQLELHEKIKHLVPSSPVEILGKKGSKQLVQFQDCHASRSIKFGNLNVLDFLAVGRQFVAPPSLHPENVVYKYSKDSLLDVKRTDLPTFEPKILLEIERILGKQPKEDFDTVSGRNNTLKSQASAGIVKGKSDKQIVDELLIYDQKHHSPPLFSDQREPQMKGHDAQANATKFVRSIRSSLGIAEPQAKGFDISKNLFRMSDVKAEEISWLWEPYIPLKKLTMIEGDPGVGKSYLTLSLASLLSLGGKDIKEPANVLMLITEDGVSDTIKNRLNKLESSQERIFVYNEAFEINDDGIKRLESLIEKTQPRLVIIDPIIAYASSIDMHRANEVRAVMAKLALVAEVNNCSIVVVRHLTKGGTEKSIYRGHGSIDFTAAARSVLLAGINSQNKDQRAIVHIKSNLAAIGKSQGYKITEGKLEWTGACDITADDILMEVKEFKKDKAEEFLENLLRSGQKLERDIRKAAEAAGFSKRTIDRAKSALAIESKQEHVEGKKGGGPWVWSLPPF